VLSNFLVFAYVSFLSLLFGFSLTNFFNRRSDTRPSLTILTVLGLALLTAIGAIISFVIPLGLWANLILISTALILLLASGKPFFALHCPGEIRPAPFEL
jgi:peptidoglycan/LPS O-acetylase OafA/YrhL